jgi:hypothetical protein
MAPYRFRVSANEAAHSEMIWVDHEIIPAGILGRGHGNAPDKICRKLVGSRIHPFSMERAAPKAKPKLLFKRRASSHLKKYHDHPRPHTALSWMDAKTVA